MISHGILPQDDSTGLSLWLSIAEISGTIRWVKIDATLVKGDIKDSLVKDNATGLELHDMDNFIDLWALDQSRNIGGSTGAIVNVSTV